VAAHPYQSIQACASSSQGRPRWCSAYIVVSLTTGLPDQKTASSPDRFPASGSRTRWPKRPLCGETTRHAAPIAAERLVPFEGRAAAW